MSEEEKKDVAHPRGPPKLSDEQKRKLAESRKEEDEIRQAKLEEARRLILSMDVKYPPEMANPLPPANVMSRKVEIQTNLFGIRMDEDHPIHKYDVFIYSEFGTGDTVKHLEFTKKGKNDYMVSDRRRTCLAIFAKAIKEAVFYRDDLMFYYDGQCIMYTLEKLVFPDPTKPNDTVIMEGSTVSDELQSKHIYFQVKECTDRVQAHLSDIRKIDRDMMRKDRSAMQFVDVATSMNALFNSDRFTIFANGKMFPNRPDLERLNCVKMREGKVLVPGCKKTIKLIEGPRGRNNASPAIAIDSLKVAFHVKEKLIDKAIDFFVDINNASYHEREEFASMIKGVGCSLIHLKGSKKLEIFGVTRDDATKMIEINLPSDIRRSMTVAEYFQSRYKLDLKYPLAPLIWSKERGSVNLYPMEVLEVLPMQRVTIPQTTSIQSQVATKECAVPPGVRQKNIADQCKMHDLFNPDQPYLKAAGLSIIPTPLKANARVLGGPILQYKSSNMTITTPQWRPPLNYQFAVPGGCDKWAIFILRGARDIFNDQDMTRFCEVFTKRCRERGMRIGAPFKMEVLRPPPQDKSPDYEARIKIREAVSSGCTFIMFISNDYSTIHKHIKLEERYSTVVTQDLKLKTVTSLMQKNQMLTLDNIIYKTNVKLGGMNYGVSLKNLIPNYNPFPPNRLIIGIAIHQAPEVPNIHFHGERFPPPSVVGFSANMANFPTEFIGDFIYQDHKKEDLIMATTEMMEKVLDRFMGLLDSEGNKTGGEAKRPIPDQVIVYRQGINEGCYGICLTEEIPLIKGYFEQRRKGVNFTYINCQKEHSIRLMPTEFNVAEKATLQNIGAGTVIDDQITHPRFKEFFLNSHVTLQGTARTPRYTVLVDDRKLSMNELELITHALAYNFQIVNSPISIPSPLYVANRFAERGVDLYTSKQCDEMATSVQKIRVTIPQMNEDLTYCNTTLGKSRINA